MELPRDRTIWGKALHGATDAIHSQSMLIAQRTSLQVSNY
jgi:hypothetical protein